MSISKSDITVRRLPKQGIMSESVEGTLTIGNRQAVNRITESDKEDYVKSAIINRVYGDILRDFTRFAELALEDSFSEKVDELKDLRDEIIKKLRGDGPGMDRSARI